MNTPIQQSELYRKAAETIEMCAEHGIEPIIKWKKISCKLINIYLQEEFCNFEFPIAVIEGNLVWVGDYICDPYERYVKVEEVCIFKGDPEPSLKTDGRWYSLSGYKLNIPKQPLCEVEGKPVYKGDKLWFIGNENVKARQITVENYRDDLFKLQATDTGWFKLSVCSWNPPKRTVMVELLLEDAEMLSKDDRVHLLTVHASCRKALDNLK